MRWEKCKRKTRCIECGVIMHEGEERLQVMGWTKGYYRRYPKIEYRCKICGSKYFKSSGRGVGGADSGISGQVETSDIPNSSKRRGRFLRPDNEAGQI